MRYAKLIDGFPVYAPNPILHDGLWYGNPPGEVYEAEGYKPVIYTDMPIAPEGYYYEEKWTESENSITQSWELIELPSETDVDPYEAMQVLFGE
jgi:hypothetical protein